MLSDELQSHAAHFARWQAQGGVPMTAHMCGLYRTIFLAMAETAAQMEGRPIPAGQMPLPPGVVNLDAVRTHRLSGGLPSGGSAA